MRRDYNERILGLEAVGISFFNMFMEHDAVACRLEPLCAEKYADHKPVTVMKWDHRILLSDPTAVGPRGAANHKDRMKPRQTWPHSDSPTWF